MAQRFVVDNSVVMAWCFEDEADAYADAVLGSLETWEAVVPAVWPLEAANVLVVAERKGRLTHASVARFLALLSGLPIAIEQESAERVLNEILALAREHRLSSYDASYLDLAMTAGLPLATRDAALVAAMNACDVPLFAPLAAGA